MEKNNFQYSNSEVEALFCQWTLYASNILIKIFKSILKSKNSCMTIRALTQGFTVKYKTACTGS